MSTPSRDPRAERNSLLQTTGIALTIGAIFLGASFFNLNIHESQIRHQVVYDEITSDIRQPMKDIENDFKVAASRNQTLPFEIAARGVLKPEKIEAQIKAKISQRAETDRLILQSMAALFALTSLVGLGGVVVEHRKITPPSTPPAPQ